ncbi:MAG: hypothetical protein JO205_11000 [Pseudolabrys sp.]|nr:hypothetical protein [Pseudolabrys sp.]
MRFGVGAVVAAVAVCVAASSAIAQTPTTKRTVVTNRDRTVFVSRDQDGRTRTRIIIQRRSYLDAGTQVKPGERKFTDYVWGPTHSAVAPAMNNTAFTVDNQFRPGPFDLPGPRNPMQW